MEKPLQFKKNPAEATERTENSDAIASELSPENQGFFSRMSEKAKDIAKKTFEAVRKIPGVDNLVYKLQLNYNDFWAGKYEKSAAVERGKMGTFDLQAGALDSAKSEIESAITSLRDQKLPGVDSLELKLKVIDAQKDELLRKKENSKSKSENRGEKGKEYASKRDQIADKLVSGYDQKLAPMEEKLKILQNLKNQADLLRVAAEVKHRSNLSKLQGLENKKLQIEKAYALAGMSERQIRRDQVIKTLNETLEASREKIQSEKERLEKRQAKINEKIAKVEDKARPYREKREIFAKVKDKRPGVSPGGRGQASAGRESAPAKDKASPEEMEAEKPMISELITLWNDEQRKYGVYPGSPEFIEQNPFLRTIDLRGNQRLSFADFKTILESYYNFKKVPLDKFKQAAAEIEEQIKIEEEAKEAREKGKQI